MANSDRFPELDQWRGWALITMVIYHFFVMFRIAGLIPGFSTESLSYITLEAIGWFARLSFVTLVGISSYISFTRRQQVKQNPKQIQRHFFERGLMVFGGGLVITVGSLIIIPDLYIRFGILHFLGLSIIILPFFLRLNRPLQLLSVISLIFIDTLGPSTAQLTPTIYYVGLGLGLVQPQATVDYFPFITWFPLIAIGTWLGNYFYPNLQRRFAKLQTTPNLISLIGNHTFKIYFLHIIILLAIIGIFRIS